MLHTTILDDPQQSARAAGLQYVSDEDPGFQRKRWGRGFTYLDEAGKRVRCTQSRQRFTDLVIPPAWENVWICGNPRGHIQATGYDDRGRKQYIYHPTWQQVRNQAKFDHLLRFGQALPDIRTRVDLDLRRKKLSRQKVTALVIRLLEETLIRIGNVEYAQNNQAYGLTTLRNRHLDVEGTTLYFEFQGKHGKKHHVSVQDPRLARQIKRCQELPGQELFQYIDEQNQRQALDSSNVNHYLQEVTGQPITAKDFRTWGGTVTMLARLYQLGTDSSPDQIEQNIKQAVKQTAKQLRNTVTVCRKYYIHPQVIEAYRTQDLFDIMSKIESSSKNGSKLDKYEGAVLTILGKAQ